MENKIFFLLVKKKKTEGKGDYCQQSGYGRHFPGGKRSVVDGKAEAFHKIIKGIPEKKGPESLRKDIQGVEDRSQEKESLEKNSQNLLDVFYFNLDYR